MTAKYPLLTFTVMKNEGPFLLEWVAYQKVFGADQILIMTNGCDDGTDLMLDRLDEMGVVRHIPNPCMMGPKMVGKARHPHILGFEYGKFHKEWRNADYVLMCDTDEFPVAYVGDGGLDGLMDAAGGPDVLSLCERLFGSGDHVHYDERLITERFLHCSSSAPGRWRANKGIKSISRNRLDIDIRNHRPIVPSEDEAAVHWVDGAGNPFPAEARTTHIKGLDCRGRYVLGAINHYALRSYETYIAKVDRGDAVTNYDNRHDIVYFRRRNRTEDPDDAIQRMVPHVKEERTRLLKDDTLRRLHFAAIRHHRKKVYRLLEQPGFRALYDEMLVLGGQMSAKVDKSRAAPA